MKQDINDFDDSDVSRLLRQIKEITADELYDEMSKLKSRVINLLKDYSSSLSQKDNARQLNQQIRKDATKINQDYSIIIDKFNTSVDYSIMSIDSVAPLQKQEKEMNNMFNLIEDFLEKFQGKKPQHNLYTSFLSDRLERSGISIADVSIIDVNQRIDVIRQQLQSSLQDKKYSQIIVLETIDALGMAYQEQKIDNIRQIIKKIEKQMQSCKDDTTDLYYLLSKALESCKEKEEELNGQSIIEDKDQKRKFFDMALQIKSDLPSDHPGRKTLVSMLYEQAQGLKENEWYWWIKKQLSL